MQGSVFTGISVREATIWWNANIKPKLGSSVFCCFNFKHVLWYLHHKKEWCDKTVVSQKLTSLPLQNLFSRNYTVWQVPRCERRNKHKKNCHSSYQIYVTSEFSYLNYSSYFLYSPGFNTVSYTLLTLHLFIGCRYFSSNLWYT